MKYIVLSECIALGRKLKVGEIVELETEVADALSRLGRIEQHTGEVEVQPVVAEDREEKPVVTRKTRAKKAK